MAKKKKKAFSAGIALIMVFLIAVIYTGYHVFNLLTDQEVTTIVSGVMTHSDTIGSRGYIFRDETLLVSENTGAIDYLVGDGEKVSKNQMIADVYDNKGGYNVRTTVQSIDRQIALLEKSYVGDAPVDYVALRAEANTLYYTLMSSLNAGDAGSLNSQIDEMMIILNKINSMTYDGKEELSQTLAQLYTVRNNILSGGCLTEYSGESGYFYYQPDGYEWYFSTEKLNAMNEDYFYALDEHVLENNETLPANVYGKIAKNTSWYFVTALSPKDAADFKIGNEYSLLFPENNNTELMMTFDRTIEAKENGKVICVFYCNKLPNNFKLERAQNVQIAKSSVSGIYVPRSALAKENGIRGVYVLKGSIVHFRNVEVIYQNLDYCLVRVDAVDEGDFYALGKNEHIITNNVNSMFHGRVLE